MTTEDNADRTVTGFFERQRDAEAAVRRLQDIGVDRDHVTMVPHARPTDAMPGRPQSGGVLGVFGDMMSPRGEAGFAEGDRRDGFLVSVRTEAEHDDQVMEILGDAGAVNLDEHTDTAQI